MGVDEKLIEGDRKRGKVRESEVLYKLNVKEESQGEEKLSFQSSPACLFNSSHATKVQNLKTAEKQETCGETATN